MPASKLYTRTVVDHDVRRVRTRRGSVHGMNRTPVRRATEPDTPAKLNIANPPRRRARAMAARQG